MKAIIIIFMLIGSSFGSYLPVFWNDNFLSFSSVLFSGIGGILGIYLGYKLAKKNGIE